MRTDLNFDRMRDAQKPASCLDTIENRPYNIVESGENGTALPGQWRASPGRDGSGLRRRRDTRRPGELPSETNRKEKKHECS